MRKLAVLNIETVPLANFDNRFFAALVDMGVMLVSIAMMVIALWLFTGGSLDFLTLRENSTRCLLFAAVSQYT